MGRDQFWICFVGTRMKSSLWARRVNLVRSSLLLWYLMIAIYMGFRICLMWDIGSGLLNRVSASWES